MIKYNKINQKKQQKITQVNPGYSIKPIAWVIDRDKFTKYFFFKYEATLPTYLTLEVQIEKKKQKTKSMKPIYNPTKIKIKNITKPNSQKQYNIE